MDTASIIEQVGGDVQGPIALDPSDYGPWFKLMTREALSSDEQLGGRDIGSLNLEAALGLPGAENLDIHACVLKLNAWAERVRAFTAEHWDLFDRTPEKYENSPGGFRMMALATVLQKHLGVSYNMPFSEGDYNATDSRNHFVHGPLGGHGGTCVNLPVLYIAVGRRLGYPLKLVRAKDHFFARWEEPGGERFNIECTMRGFVRLDDQHFRDRPKPISELALRGGHYLRSLTP